ncbi:MAG: hypothetical protein ACR2PB_05950 [Desulfocapsaceae bacterium]
MSTETGMIEIHPAAPHHLPGYIPGPDGSDPLFTIVVVSMLILFLVAGVIYFRLHSLPEHMGEKANSTQLQLISILAILALFTHNNAFWVLALLLAAIRIPDYLTPIETIAKSLAAIAADNKAKDTLEPPSVPDNGPGEDGPPTAPIPDERTKPAKTEREEK